MKQNNALLVFLLFAASLMPACSSDNMSDTDIQNNINEELANYQAGAALHATVDQGVATVTGECSGEGCAAKLADDVKDMKGVKDVAMNVIERK